MITQYEVPNFIKDNIPQLAELYYPTRLSLLLYASITHFSDFTRHQVEAHNYAKAKQCFMVAEKLYFEGDRMVRIVMDNHFMYTITSSIAVKESAILEREHIIPEKLYKVYKRKLQQQH